MSMVELRKIKKYFHVERGYLKSAAGVVKAVDGVSLVIEKGGSFGLVGESGCGKTTLGKIVLGILKSDSGEARLSTKAAQVIFQDPYNSLDPKMRVGEIIAEGLTVGKRGISYRSSGGKIMFLDSAFGLARRIILPESRTCRQVKEALELVRLPKTAIDKYPHQFSGGERQRIAIARAIITNPEFIVCDEPVSSLDVTIQLQILNLLKDIQRSLSITYLFISHDLRVVKFMCDTIAVMREGRIVESGSSEKIYAAPTNPYTKLLLSSILDIYPAA